MKTRSVMMQTLCVPCACRCRYCLLSWNGKTVGADYDRSQNLAERFYAWLKQERPELSFHFSIGYSMEHPHLLDAVDFMNRIGSVSGKFLQCDGLSFREDKELETWLLQLREHGVEQLNFTFYGMPAYHDIFAGRKGDHAYMLRILRSAAQIGFHVSVGIPLTQENIYQIDELVAELEAHGANIVRLLIPHGEGRGVQIESIRLAVDDLSAISEQNRLKLNRKVYQTEAEWCKIRGGEPETDRTLIISLTEENIDRLERTPFSEMIAEVETLDDAYYSAFPSFRELLDMYGDGEGNKLYSRRDLFLRVRRQYAKEHNEQVYDVTDERQSGSRRY